jgi:hypothetical protein
MNLHACYAYIAPTITILYLGFMTLAAIKSREDYHKWMITLWLIIPPCCWFSVSLKTLSSLKLAHILAVILSTIWAILMLILVFGIMGSAMHNRQLLIIASLLTWILPFTCALKVLRKPLEKPLGSRLNGLLPKSTPKHR